MMIRVNRNRELTMLLFNRKAYTLSQFILLWVLGILFVILVFLTVLRYRATAQAKEVENFMKEVRAEQEDRCASGREYAVYDKRLKMFYKRKNTLGRVRYDLSSGEGIMAHHKFYGYHLRMPSYADGRICCDDCEKLNRYYSSCSVLKKMKDFVQPDPECVAYVPNKKKDKQHTAGPVSVTDTKFTAEPASVREPVEKAMEEIATQPSVTDGADIAEGTQPQTQPAQESSANITDQTVPSQKEGEVVAVQKVAVPVKKCKTPAQEFFIDDCSVYQAGARGSVVHTWNSATCSYEITQTCEIPPLWKSSSNTKEEKGLYPSDVDSYCAELVKKDPCAKGSAAGQECATPGTVCYKNCQITKQNEVKESALLIFYDVEVKVEQLRCLPGKEVTVTVP